VTSLAAALCVGLGGALGSLARWRLGVLIAASWPSQTFPWATLTVNVLGSFLFGIVAALVMPVDGPSREPLRLLLLTGVLGGFTTFSSFSHETLKLVHEGRTELAFANVAVQLVLGLTACWAGMWTTRFALKITG
jgi:CrcB protein